MKNSLKRILSLTLAAVLTLSLTACSNEPNSSSTTDSSSQSTSGEAKVLKVGASPSPHAEILQSVKETLAAQGITLEIVEFTDYVLPNIALHDGDLDANFFQHLPYLELFNENNRTDIISVSAIHFEPMGIYGGKTTDLSAIPDGASVAIPNDGTNEARALQLLAAQGLIKLKDGAGLAATPIDIVENTKNLQFTEIEAAQLPRILNDVDIAVVNGNYAIDGGITDKVIVTESADSEGAQTFANILAVRSGTEENEEIKALVAALTSEETRAFITEKYGTAAVPVF